MKGRQPADGPVEWARVKAVVFDKDGTLIDLHARWVPWIRSVCREVAEACRDDEAVAALHAALGVSGNRLEAEGAAAVHTSAVIKQVAVDLMVSRGHEPSMAAESVVVAVRAAPMGPLIPLGDVAALMAALVERGMRVAIATSDDRVNTLAELDEMGLTGFIAGLRCGDDGGPIKPNPAVLAMLADELGVAVASLVFVGDSVHDMATAKAASVPFIGVLGGSSGEDVLRAGASAVIAAPGDLVGLID